jgi:hypothetical protein
MLYMRPTRDDFKQESCRPSDKIRELEWAIARLSPDRTDPERFYAQKDWCVKTLRSLRSAVAQAGL